MTFCDRWLYIVQDHNLWKVEPTTGEYEPVGKTGIGEGATELTCVGGRLYLMFAQKLWSIDPATGKISLTGTKVFRAPKSMVAETRVKTYGMEGMRATLDHTTGSGPANRSDERSLLTGEAWLSRLCSERRRREKCRITRGNH